MVHVFIHSSYNICIPPMRLFNPLAVRAWACLLAAFVSLILPYSSQGFVTSKPSQRYLLLSSPGFISRSESQPHLQAVIRCEAEEKQVVEAGDFFAHIFFAKGMQETPPELTSLVRKTWLQRYGPLMGKRRFDSVIFVSRDEDTKKLNGVVVADISVIDLANQQILFKEQGEDIINSRLSLLGPKQKRAYKNANIAMLLDGLVKEAPIIDRETGKEAKFLLAPVLANLAVDPSARGTGIGKALCAEIHKWSASWVEGLKRHIYDEENNNTEEARVVLPQVWLKAESTNTPAVKLYEGLGYKQMWTDEAGNELRLTPDGGLEIDTVTHTVMALSVEQEVL